MKILFLDCSSGVSGDMLLAALGELAGGVDVLREGLLSLGIPELSVEGRDVLRAGIGATKIDVLIDGRSGGDPGLVQAPAPRHGHAHAHANHEHAHADHGHPDPDHGRGSGTHGGGEHAHRTLAEIEAVISRSRLAASIKDRSVEVFRRLVGAEAEVHRVPPDEVRLHEAGALDAIADVVGTVLLLDRLSTDRVAASAVNVGGGSVTCEHGLYPVPGPATALLLRGIPIYSSGAEGELATPTGAALLSTIVQEFGPLPPMKLATVGAGAGSRDTSPRPNILRAFLGEGAATTGGEGEVVVIECTIDDLNPQNYGYLVEKLAGAGALEVFFTPVHMKKNRPGVLVTTLGPEAVLPALSEILFAETTTIGFRYRRERRRELERRFEEVWTPYGTVRMKISSDAGVIRSAQPEYEDCRRLAAERQVPLKEVQAAAAAAWRDGRLPPRPGAALPAVREK